MDDNQIVNGRIEIYDTTLRDSTLQETINFSVADKCQSARRKWFDTALVM